MYVPKDFAVTDRAELLSFIRAHPFGILVSAGGNGPLFATHAPFVVLNEAPLRLGVHVARANPHWRSVNVSPVLAIFHGPHGFVSASWYADPAHNVPTWNYAAVHCTGEAAIADEAALQRILTSLVQEFEGDRGWRMDLADAGYIERMQQGIVGIEIAVAQIEGKYKYSQNRTLEDRGRVIAALARSKRREDGELAQAMEHVGEATTPRG